MKKSLRKIMALLLAALTVLSIAACSGGQSGGEAADAGGEEGKRPVLGVSLFYRRDEYYKDLDAAFAREAEANGIDIIIQDADADAAKQTQQIEDFIQQGVDAIALAPCDPAGLVPVIESAVDAGIPVFVFDNMAESEKVSTSVNFDYAEDGEMVGEWTKTYIDENLGGNAKVAVIDFAASPIVCGGRKNGFLSVVTQMPGVEVVSEQDGKATRADSMSVMENILTSNPDVQIVYGINFDTCAGAAAAIDAANRKDIIVVGCAYGEEGFKALAGNDPIIKAFSTSSPQQQAKDTVAAVATVLGGGEVPKDTLSHSMLLDAELIKDYDWESIIAQRNE